MKLGHVKVEETDAGDHYDPEAKAIRLLPKHFGGRSLAAVVIAAHETGHAMQDATGYPPLQARTRLAKQAIRVEKVAAVVMLAAPIVMALAKAPHILIIEVFVGVMIFALSILLHAVTLPVEFDASFRRALPVLKAGRYLERQGHAGGQANPARRRLHLRCRRGHEPARRRALAARAADLASAPQLQRGDAGGDVEALLGRTLNGCRMMFLFEPPISALAPTPRPTVASALTPP